MGGLAIAPVKIKMCGMTRTEDIQQAIALGVDAIGLIFYPKSKRFVSLEKAQSLLKNAALPPFVSLVAVLVNPDASQVREILHALPVDCLQFHGDETQEFCAGFAKKYIKAIPAKNTEAVLHASTQYTNARALLLDTPSNLADVRGGTGEVFDWSLIPSARTKPLILAGGLDASNVGQAVSAIQPYAVDVCSGIESSPGIKDSNKMTAFINALQKVNHG